MDVILEGRHGCCRDDGTTGNAETKRQQVDTGLEEVIAVNCVALDAPENDDRDKVNA